MKHESQDSLTESAIRVERFYKKYKFLFYSLVAVLIIWAAGTYLYQTYESKKIAANNALFTSLVQKPTKEGLLKLKKENINLYALLVLSLNDKQEFKALVDDKGLNQDLKELVLYKEGKKSTFLKDYSAALKGFELLEEKKFKLAKTQFAKVSPTSSLYPLVQSLKHFQVVK